MRLSEQPFFGDENICKGMEISSEQRSKFHMYSSHLRLTRIHARRKLFPEVRKGIRKV